MVRPHRDEHAGRATAGVRRAPGRHLHQATLGPTDVPARRPTLLAVDVGAGDHVLGSRDAPVTLVQYADFECPFCGRAFPELKSVLHDLGRRVRFVFRHFPVIEAHPHAESAAEVAEAAGAQGKFWEMHDLLFRRQAALDDEHLLAYARELGLEDRKSTRLNSSHSQISYAVFCLKKKMNSPLKSSR